MRPPEYEIPVHEIAKPYLLLVGDMEDRGHAKTGLGLRDWCPDDCIGQYRFNERAVDLGLPQLTPAEARAKGVGTMVIGITPAGGRIAENWHATLIEALEAGLDIASGLHARLSDIPAVAEAAKRLGRKLHDVRHSPRATHVGSGLKRPGKRMLMVGTDCVVGKKYTALALSRAMTARGMNADFRATGQTGVLIAGRGVAIDAVVSDFLSGIVEALSPANDPEHWDVIEGQGSLFHPSFAAVTLGLVHGSQPDAMVLCHNPRRTTILDHPDYPTPALAVAIAAYTQAAHLTNKAARVVAISLNTEGFSDAESASLLAAASAETGLPAFDPVRTPLGPVLDQLEGTLQAA
ncbi:MAG: DUF1611 domain-containing protein [Devosia sp.]